MIDRGEGKERFFAGYGMGLSFSRVNFVNITGEYLATLKHMQTNTARKENFPILSVFLNPLELRTYAPAVRECVPGTRMPPYPALRSPCLAASHSAYTVCRKSLRTKHLGAQTADTARAERSQWGAGLYGVASDTNVQQVTQLRI